MPISRQKRDAMHRRASPLGMTSEINTSVNTAARLKTGPELWKHAFDGQAEDREERSFDCDVEQQNRDEQR